MSSLSLPSYLSLFSFQCALFLPGVGLRPPISRVSWSGLSSTVSLWNLPGVSASEKPGGDEQNRTVDPLLARQVLSQLSYTPG